MTTPPPPQELNQMPPRRKDYLLCAKNDLVSHLAALCREYGLTEIEMLFLLNWTARDEIMAILQKEKTVNP